MHFSHSTSALHYHLRYLKYRLYVFRLLLILAKNCIEDKKFWIEFIIVCTVFFIPILNSKRDKSVCLFYVECWSISQVFVTVSVTDRISPKAMLTLLMKRVELAIAVSCQQWVNSLVTFHPRTYWHCWWREWNWQ